MGHHSETGLKLVHRFNNVLSLQSSTEVDTLVLGVRDV